jgi:hypothetical protein
MHWQLKLEPLYANLPEPIVGDFKYNTEFAFDLINADPDKFEILYSYRFTVFIEDGKAEFEYGGEILVHFDDDDDYEKFASDPASIPGALKFDVMYSTRQFFEAMSLFFHIDSYV